MGGNMIRSRSDAHGRADVRGGRAFLSHRRTPLCKSTPFRACLPPIRLARGAARHARASAARQAGGGGGLDRGRPAWLSLQVLLDSYALELQWLDRTLVAMRDEIHNTEELLRCVRVCARASVLPLAASSVRACVRACVSTPYARSQLQMDVCARAPGCACAHHHVCVCARAGCSPARGCDRRRQHANAKWA